MKTTSMTSRMTSRAVLARSMGTPWATVPRIAPFAGVGPDSYLFTDVVHAPSGRPPV